MTQQDPGKSPGAGEVVTQLVQLSFAGETPNVAALGTGLPSLDFSSITVDRVAKVAATSGGDVNLENMAQKITEQKELVRDREQKLDAVEKVMKCYRKVLEELFQERERLQEKQSACEVELTIVEQSIQEKHSTKKTLTDELEELGRLIQTAVEAAVESDESVDNQEANRVSQQRITDDLALIDHDINELEERKAAVEKRLCKLREKEQTTFHSLSEIGNEDDDLEELEKAKKDLQKHKKKLEAFESLITLGTRLHNDLGHWAHMLKDLGSIFTEDEPYTETHTN
jgi:DNA repair exonuclease SbcCD ATPase subunit